LEQIVLEEEDEESEESSDSEPESDEEPFGTVGAARAS
jgi:rapamycin-insensitive companion of mTOR